jgi:kanamycin kinase
MFEAVEARLRSAYPSHEWIPVTHGMSGALTYRLAGRPQELFVKLARASAHPDPRTGMLAEAWRLEWLTAKGFPAAKLVDAGESEAVSWLVMTAVPGRPASDPWPADQRMRVIDAVAEILSALHALPASDCPFDRTLDVALGNVRRALDEGLLDRSPEEMDAWERDLDRRSLLAELERTRPPAEDLAVCHGDYCLPNVMIDPETLQPTGLVDLGRLGRADRYADLALMRRSIGSETLNPQYGQAHVDRFLAGYGADPSDPRLDYYARLDWLF